ncbi:hypothetical protein ABZ153_33350 [Streptomyces sp. NPDC006290]|uniref:hypothetical protein n=1 Tax=Streptomyces sp. NPDC006290 TaxID=3156745 RepID=UPI0033B634E2
MSVTRLRHSLDLLEAATRQGATAEENDLMRQASDELPRLRRGVGAQTPVPSPRSRFRKPEHLPTPTPAIAPLSTRGSAAAPQAPRQQRQSRRAAIRQARNILDRLTQPIPLADAEIPELVRELTDAVDRAGTGLAASEQRRARSWIERSAQPEAARTAFGHEALTPDSLRSAANAVRGALKKTAREQTTTWATLKRRLGSALPRMTALERVSVLILVDQQAPKDQPLLSSLIAAADPSLTSYRQIVSALGLDAPEDDDELRDVLEADVRQVHLHWSHP